MEGDSARQLNHCWLVLTPSVDDRAWRNEIKRAAHDAGYILVPDSEAGYAPDDADVLILTQDAERARQSGTSRIAAIVAEPGSSPEAVADQSGMAAPERDWHAALLLARALSLSPDHRVVTDRDLAKRPAEIILFERLRLTPPASQAEVSRNPPLTNAFKLYSASKSELADPVSWAEQLFTFEPKSAKDWPAFGVLDTTGRPRMMVNGPYYAMPPGLWRACIKFSVDQDAAKRQYRLDWGTRTACVSEYCTPRAPGMYELELDFMWTEVDVAEIRIILMEGSFNGTMIFQGMTVRRIDEASGSPTHAAA